MSGRLTDLDRQIATVRQLGAVVNAMRGIAGTRAQQGRVLLPTIHAYAETAARAIGQARRLDEDRDIPRDAPLPRRKGRPALVLFGAEQGFAGAFPEQVLNAAGAEFETGHIFLIGARTGAIAAQRDLAAGWTANLPARAAALPELAAAIVDALYDHLAAEGPVTVTTIHSAWQAGSGTRIVRRRLLPLPGDLSAGRTGDLPLVNLPADQLIAQFGQEYVFARICEAAAEAFAAENEARAATMGSARRDIDSKLVALKAKQRLNRQETITAEVVELAAGARTGQRAKIGM